MIVTAPGAPHVAPVPTPAGTAAAGLLRTAQRRLVSLDAYRGLVMLALLTEGYFDGFGTDVLPGHPLAAFVGRQFQHVAWQGCALWDLIQPSFMFMVGVAIPFALAARYARGESTARIALQVIRRSAILIALSLVIVSRHRAQTEFNFADDVLAQIGLAYPFACLFAGRGVRAQVAAIAAILAGYWLLFFLHPVRLTAASAGVSVPPDAFQGLFAHWNRAGNFAADFDRWFLNLFPRSTPFTSSHAGLATLNFVPSIATMAFGVTVGELLRSGRAPLDKFRRLLVSGVLCLATGLLAGYAVCPIVKAIWTPSWVLFSAGWTILALAVFYWAIDVKGFTAWTFPLVVLGVNSLAVYLILHISKDWIWNTLSTHFGPMHWTTHSIVVATIVWLTAAWMYRRQIIVTA